MSLKLTKADRDRRDEIVALLQERKEKLETKVSAFNDLLSTARADVEEAMGRYNDALDEAKEFTDNVANEAQATIEEKSEKWQEGEKGQAAVEWQQLWSEIDLDHVDIDFPDEIEFEVSHAEELETLAEAPE